MELETQGGDKDRICEEALARSVCYGILARALHPPSEELFRELQSEQTQDALLYAASILGGLLPPEQATPEHATTENLSVNLPARVAAWLRTFPSVSLDRLREIHGRAFGHTARGSVCPYETEYGAEGLFQQPRQLASITGFYRAFGLKPRETERERADHVSCELEFMGFLSRKEAYAIQCGEEGLLQETRRAIVLFLRDHVALFGRAFARLLAEHDPKGYFGNLGDVLFDFLTLECHRLGIQPGPPVLRLRSSEEDSVPMACGSDSDLVQIALPN
jgi:TorA maturation chaperone TorD